MIKIEKIKTRWRKQWLAILLMAAAFSVLGQEGEPSSNIPSSFGINQFQTSENLSSGVLNVNLPIESSIIPVSLSYTTSGIRVNQRPGIVGLGWNLNAGGYILRQKRGFADDHEQGYSGENQRGAGVTSSPSQTYFPHYVKISGNGTQGGQVTPYDSEPDIYQFQFMGQGGTFTIDHNRNIVKLSANNLKIVKDYNPTTNKYDGFTITDEQGNQYLFSVKENIRTLVDNNEIENYTLKWHLTSITSYATGEITNFSYINSPLYKEASRFRTRRVYYATENYHSSEDKNIEQEYTSAKLLKSVTFNNTEVEFSYTSRTDITELRKLYSIAYKINGVQSLSYYFQYKYLGDIGAKRLMLAGVTKSSLDIYLFQFSYFGEEASESTLPAYNSTKQDHWGFYNSNSNSSLYIQLGANRAPNLERTRANSLKKMYDSNGGYEEYDYELNEYRLSGSDYPAGGLRISKLWKKDGEGINYEMRTYNYDIPVTTSSSGEIYNEPDYDFRYVDEGEDPDQILDEHIEYSKKNLMDDQGRHIVYKYVTITDIDGGQTQFKFKTFADDISHFGTGNLLSRFVKGWNRNENEFEGTSIVNLTEYDGPFGSSSFKGTAAGQLEEKLVMDGNGNLLIKEEYSYLSRSTGAIVLGMNFLKQGFRRNTNFGSNKRIDEFLASVYELKCGYLLTDKITQTIYDANNASKYRTTVTDMFYDADHPLPNKQESYLLSEPTKKQKAETDYLFRESVPPSQVASNNLLSLVKETRNYINGNQISRSTNGFDTPNGKLVVTSGASYSKAILVSSNGYTYNSKGYVVQQVDGFSNFKSSSVFDDYGRVIAEASNAEYTRIAYTSFQMNDGGGWTTPTLTSPDGCLETQLNCMEACAPGDLTCTNACSSAATTCENNANLTDGNFDRYAFKLSQGNVSKTLVAGTYKLSFWKKTGTVSFGGVSSSTLLETRTLGDWVFESWKLVLSGNSTLTISGTAVIDHLALSPEESRMSTTTYHAIFGKSAEMDANNNMIFYEYDFAGRLTTVKDKNQDILSHTTYNIAGYRNLSETSYAANPYGNTKEIFVTSNKVWSASSNVGWISLSRENNLPMDKLILSVQQNNTQSSRTGTVTISGSSIASQTITVTQQAAPASFLNVTPASVDITLNNTAYVEVTSNIAWTATVTTGQGFIFVTDGENIGDGEFSISRSLQQPGISNTTTLVTGTVTVTGGGITKYIQVTYYQ
tara:strand:+ start:2770 stop:6423 length:3654 start_codon:yes stop_codon:yes gene_type:complete